MFFCWNMTDYLNLNILIIILMIKTFFFFFFVIITSKFIRSFQNSFKNILIILILCEICLSWHISMW